MAPVPNILFPFSSALPPQAFDNIIEWSGINFLWLKSYLCPCVGDQGNPQPNCVVCQQRGIYWANPQGPFILLLTYVSFAGRAVDVGFSNDPTYGGEFDATPILTIPEITAPIWAQSAVMDLFIEVDSVTRYNTVLRVNENTTIPYWHNYSLTIAPTGAVTVYNQSSGNLVSGVAYTVSGLSVTLNDPTYTEGTSYTVEYTSAPIYVSYGKMGGEPHQRPFGQGLLYPKRFKIKDLDLWLRDNPIGLLSNVQGS
jgi:hypothetical protein